MGREQNRTGEYAAQSMCWSISVDRPLGTILQGRFSPLSSIVGTMGHLTRHGGERIMSSVPSGFSLLCMMRNMCNAARPVRNVLK